MIFTKFGYRFKVTDRGVAMENTHGAWVLIFVHDFRTLFSEDSDRG